MNARRIIAAAISTVALIVVNIGVADTASARGSSWEISGKTTQAQTTGSSWD